MFDDLVTKSSSNPTVSSPDAPERRLLLRQVNADPAALSIGA
jgi:tRNA U34 5-carboxymethylaminomethyl modifying enzyme MnmG/GidA